MLLDHLGESLVAFWALPGCMIERAHFSFARGLFKRRCSSPKSLSLIPNSKDPADSKSQVSTSPLELGT